MSARLYQELHWGHPGRDEVLSLDFPDPRQGPRAVLGELISVTYRTIKGDQGKVEDFVHDFGPKRPVWSERRPLLVVVARDRLVIAGGAYRVREEGIVG